MSQENTSATSIEEIKQSRIAQVELPETLVGAFQLAKTVARGDFFLMGSAVRRCVLNEPKSSADIDFIGEFDLDHVQEYFGDRFIRRWPQFNTVKIDWNGTEIDFIASRRIRDTLEGGDVTLSLMCMDQDGYVYDPLNYIDDFRKKLIRIDDPIKKITISPERTLRILRFAAELGYEVDEPTRNACTTKAYLMNVANTEYALNKFLHMQPSKMDRATEIATEYGISDKVKALIADRFESDIRSDPQLSSTRSLLEGLLETSDFFIFGGSLRDIALRKTLKM